ncbi:MAG: hypothetical protein PHW56_10930, partial [Methanosarcinaceae archaeon]|nr:hypothetical protein [Methanosarcinaceae archaeon]
HRGPFLRCTVLHFFQGPIFAVETGFRQMFIDFRVWGDGALTGRIGDRPFRDGKQKKSNSLKPVSDFRDGGSKLNTV